MTTEGTCFWEGAVYDDLKSGELLSSDIVHSYGVYESCET